MIDYSAISESRQPRRMVFSCPFTQALGPIVQSVFDGTNPNLILYSAKFNVAFVTGDFSEIVGQNWGSSCIIWLMMTDEGGARGQLSRQHIDGNGNRREEEP